MQRSRAYLAGIMAGLLGVLVLAGAVVYRVFRPAEVVTAARVPYPAANVAPTGVIGTLSAAPLIVDGRLRVYASTRQVRAEAPVHAATHRTPYWSYRRWPEQLSGLLAVREAVVSRWSDGQVVALDATTGQVAWRAAGPPPPRGYAGRATGASTGYAPEGLYAAEAPGSRRPVVVVSVPGEVRGYDAATGRQLWRVTEPACRSSSFTTAAGLVATVDACAGARTVNFRDAGTGAPVARWQPPEPATKVTPVGCAGGRSACAAMRTTGERARGWLLNRPQPAASPALDRPSSWLVGDVAVTGAGDGVTARSARTGEELWRRPVSGFGRVLAVQRDRVHLLSDAQELVTLDAASGAELSRFVLDHDDEGTAWAPGWVYARDGYVAIERLTRPVRPEGNDREYYFTSEPVIFAGT